SFQFPPHVRALRRGQGQRLFNSILGPIQENPRNPQIQNCARFLRRRIRVRCPRARSRLTHQPLRRFQESQPNRSTPHHRSIAPAGVRIIPEVAGSTLFRILQIVRHVQNRARHHAHVFCRFLPSMKSHRQIPCLYPAALQERFRNQQRHLRVVRILPLFPQAGRNHLPQTRRILSANRIARQKLPRLPHAGTQPAPATPPDPCYAPNRPPNTQPPPPARHPPPAPPNTPSRSRFWRAPLVRSPSLAVQSSPGSRMGGLALYWLRASPFLTPMPKTVSPLPFPNLGLGGTLVAAFVCSFFAAQIACDLTVLILFGPHAFFSKGLRVASWKHAILSNGVALPWYGNLLIGPPTILFTVILIFGAEFALSRTRSFLSRKLPWATALALFLAGAALLAF